MHGARTHQRLGHMAQFALAVLANRFCWFDVAEGHGDLRDRPRFELRAAAKFAFDDLFALARGLFRRHLTTTFLPPFWPALASHFFPAALFPVATRRSSDLLAARRRHDAERLAVLRHRAARDVDLVAAQNFGDR